MMDNAEAMARVRGLGDRFAGPDGNTWTAWLQFWPWAHDLLAKLALLVGDEDVLWASGVAGNRDGGNAYFVLFTSDAFIEGGVRPDSSAATDRGWIRASAWSVITQVRVDRISPLDESRPDAPWPLHLDAHLEVDRGSGPRSILLPVADDGVTALAEFLPRLLAGIGR